MKVYLAPNPRTRDNADGGIRRVIDAQIKYLPEFGIQVTRRIEDADLTAGHVDYLPLADGKPFISHNHGLMWREYFSDAASYQVNRAIVNALKQADAITVPSRWVANALGYGLLRTPRVIYHGVDAGEWRPSGEWSKYVLWNKARVDAVSDPRDMNTLAAMMPRTQFVSTVGKPSPNVEICGVMPYERHKRYIERAGVYLVTARETFGIGTLEAMACGVPVAGWDYGGQAEIVVNGETGYLAPYGDYAALADCVRRCFDERERLGANARADVLTRWQWRDKIAQYAHLYAEVLRAWNEPRPKVSVIVPCHNLAKYLPDALRSVMQQTFNDWECIIVDDASTDNTPNVAEEYVRLEPRISYVRTPENFGLARALNFGHAHARGKYVLNLDADNMLPENALAVLVNALDTHRDLHVVYGGLDTVAEDGSNQRPNAFPYERFDWYAQMAHLNQLHSSAMMRREVIEQSAGYRERQWRAEDAEFWCRVSSFGFNIARVTSEPTLIYRWRADSKSAVERRENKDIDGNWCEYFPWHTADSAAQGKQYVTNHPRAVNHPDLVPFGAQGERTDAPFWNVYHRQDPLVSVIIPVARWHTRFINDALDSLVGQTTNAWEAIVVNDTGDDWDTVAGAPYARVFKTQGGQGAGAARNLGLAHARGALVFFLDADDMLRPNALLRLMQRYARGDCGYVYCDVIVPESPQHSKVVTAPEFSQLDWLRRGLHAQAVLMATDDARRIGFDETMFAWEDWDFFVRCAIAGICGSHVAEPLVLYRKHLGQRSAYGNEHRKELFAQLRERYKDYTDGRKQMSPCGGCGSKAALRALGQRRIASVRVESTDKPLADGLVRVRYVGARQAPVTFYANGHPYQFANTPKWRYADVPAADAEVLLRYAGFERVQVIVSTQQPQTTNVETPTLQQAPEQLAQDVPETPSEPTARRRGRPKATK